jgi:hypothetical protein
VRALTLRDGLDQNTTLILTFSLREKEFFRGALKRSDEIATRINLSVCGKDLSLPLGETDAKRQ